MITKKIKMRIINKLCNGNKIVAIADSMFNLSCLISNYLSRHNKIHSDEEVYFVLYLVLIYFILNFILMMTACCSSCFQHCSCFNLKALWVYIAIMMVRMKGLAAQSTLYPQLYANRNSWSFIHCAELNNIPLIKTKFYIIFVLFYVSFFKKFPKFSDTYKHKIFFVIHRLLLKF